MKNLFSLLCLGAFSATTGQAQDADVGKVLYDRHCAACHGPEARGDGPLAPALELEPPSLRNMRELHGMFLTERIVTRIDGRDPIVSHGLPMPIFGQFFEGEDTAVKTETGQPVITSRPIVDLLTYLKTIQE